MIELKNISKHYIDGTKVVTALNNVTATFDVGEFVLVTGASGSGKSTLLNILSGTDYATSGEYILDGIDTDSFDENDWTEYRRKNIGLVYQDFRLLDEYSAQDNIKIVLSMMYSSKKKVEEMTSALLKKTGCISFAKKKVKFLSGGQKQRIAIARALAQGSSIILADEPTANLDEENAVSIVNLLKEVAKDKLVVVVTHNAEQFDDVMTRKIVLSDGRISNDEVVSTSHASITASNRQQLTNPRNTFAFGWFKYKRPMITVFAVVLLVLFLSTMIYSIFVDMLYGEKEGLIYTDIFLNLDPNRYIITKTDKSAFTEQELDEIGALDHIQNVITQDLVLDTFGYLEIPYSNKDLMLKVHPCSEITRVNYGRLPQSDDEIVVSNESGTPFYSMEQADDYFALRTNDNVLHSVKVVGWIKDTDHPIQSVYISPALFTEFYVENYHKFSTTSIIGDVNIPITNIIADKEVPTGKLLTTNSKIVTPAKVCVKLENNLSTLKLDNLDVEYLADYTDIANRYSHVDVAYVVNYEDYKSLISNKVYQISVFSETRLQPWANYNVIYPYSINEGQTDSDDLLQILFWLVACMLLAVALTLVSFVFLRYALKGEIKQVAIRKLIGFARKDIVKFVFLRIGTAISLSIVIIVSLYTGLVCCADAINTNNNFIPISNIPVLQFVILVLVVSVLFLLLLTNYVLNYQRKRKAIRGKVNA